VITRLRAIVPPLTPRILLVEDRDGLADPAAAVLGSVGLATLPGRARSGAAVGAALEADGVDLVVLVCSDPITLTEVVLRAIRVRGRDVPCVVVSTTPGESAAVEVMRAGAVDYMTVDKLVRLPVAVERELRDREERAARRRAEAAYSGLNDRLTGLLRATSGMAVMIADADGTVVQWGEGASAMLGHAAEEVVGVADLTLGHDPAELGRLAEEVGAESGLEALLTVARRGGEARDWTLVRADGSRLAAARTVAPIRSSGGAAAGYVGIARDISARRRREREQEVLARLATVVASGAAPEEVFDSVAREAGSLMDADTAGVSRFDAGHAVEVGSWQAEGARSLPVGAQTPLSGDSGMARVARSGLSERIHDLAAEIDPETVAAWPLPVNVRGTLVCPLRVEGRLWGSLRLGSTTPGFFGPADEERLQRFASVIELAIGAAQARERVVADALAGLFRSEMGLEEILDLVVAAAEQALGADRATCYVHDDSAERVVSLRTTEGDATRREFLRASIGMHRSRMPVWQLLAQHPSPTMMIGDVAGDPAIPGPVARALGTGALIGMRLEHPTIRRGDTPVMLGTLFLSFARRRRFTERDRIAAESLAGMASLALANIHLHETATRTRTEVEARSSEDPLTGLANHRGFQERLAQEVTRARRHRRALSLALVDIDRFRQVNEQHGHEVGDRVLVAIARQLQGAARETDLVARVGGEEIAWLMPETEAMEAWQAVDRAREALARSTLDGVGRVTVSAGVCDLTQSGSAGELLRLAEGALYWAKQHGRDVAFLYSPEVVEELSAEERAERLQRLQALQSIRVLARAVDAKDTSTREHSERVADLAVAIGTALGWDSERLVRLREAGLVHDVGKIGVPDRILFKPGRLTPPEYEEIMRHAEIGAEMVADVLTAEQVAWVRGHHERWDGRGYPDGLSGDRIPDGARILALADAWDVMRSPRPYHEPLSIEDAVAEVQRCAGAQFHRGVVQALLGVVADGTLPEVTTIPTA
jgi:diguanylate cyclase (GGDEF)-like protein/PAS domain S-box-containing protein